MTAPDLVAALLPVIEALDSLGVRYYVGGSVASSIHGVPRASIDADVIAELGAQHVAPLAGRGDPGLGSVGRLTERFEAGAPAGPAASTSPTSRTGPGRWVSPTFWSAPRGRQAESALQPLENAPA